MKGRKEIKTDNKEQIIYKIERLKYLAKHKYNEAKFLMVDIYTWNQIKYLFKDDLKYFGSERFTKFLGLQVSVLEDTESECLEVR